VCSLVKSFVMGMLDNFRLRFPTTTPPSLRNELGAFTQFASLPLALSGPKWSPRRIPL